MSIRPASEADLPQILAIYGPYVENTTCSFEYTIPTMEEFTLRFRSITARFPWIVWEDAGVVLGYAYASAPFHRAAYSWVAEPSIYVAPQAQGRGIGRALYAALEKSLRLQGFYTLYSVVTASNTDSVAFHLAVGYRLLAEFPDCGFKFGAWQGIIWLEKKLKSVETPTQMPLPWPEFVKTNRNFLNNLDSFTLS